MDIERVVKRKIELEKEVNELKKEIEIGRLEKKSVETTLRIYQQILKDIEDLLPIRKIKFYSRKQGGHWNFKKRMWF